MQLRHRSLDRAHDREVVVAGERRMDSTLQADLRRAPLPRLLAAAHDLLVRNEIRGAAQVGRQLPLREGAEAAAEVAHVRVLDVARDDVRDLLAADFAPEAVGGGEHAVALMAASTEQTNELLLAELVAGV